MTTKTKHTALPWFTPGKHGSGWDSYWPIKHKSENIDGGIFCDVKPLHITDEAMEQAKANAELIVRAVNSHAELLEAAKLGAKMLLRNTLQDWEDTQAYRKLKSAIAKAEGVSK
jgi:hypothetical protein